MITDAIRKATDQYGLLRIDAGLYPWLIRRPVRECVTWALARRLRAKFWPDCAIPDTSMKFGTVVDHD